MSRPRKPAEQTTSTLYRGADGHWHARVTMGRRPDGTTERKHLQRRTKTELREAVRELERSRDAGTYVWTRDDLTLAQWLEHWLETVLPMTARWKTLSTYRSQMKCHVIPDLGQWRLSELRPEHLEAHYRQLQADGHSAHVVRAVHRVLRSALNEAVRRRRLAINPAARRVKHVFAHNDTVLDFEVDGEIIKTTEDHPFWSVTGERFERADQLDSGEQVLAADGNAIPINAVDLGTTRTALAYNLAVEGIHTYHVGASSLLVHNVCPIRNPWRITKDGTAVTKRGPYGPVSKSKSDGLWWSPDTAGHGGSAWKVYDETSRGLVWRADADVYGDFIQNKHKGDRGMFIPWKDLH